MASLQTGLSLDSVAVLGGGISFDVAISVFTIDASLNSTGSFTLEGTTTDTTVDWGDGNVFTSTGGTVSPTNVYGDTSTYTVKIAGPCTRYAIGNDNVTQWRQAGTGHGLTSLSAFAQDKSALTTLPPTIPSAVNDFTSAFDNTGISSAAYGALLIYLANTNENTNVTFGAAGITRPDTPDVNAAVTTLTGRGWIITDGIPNPTFVDWTGWTSDGGSPSKVNQPVYGPGPGPNTWSVSLSAGKHVIIVGSAQNAGGMRVSIDGSPLESNLIIREISPNDVSVQAFEYDAISAGSVSVSLTSATGNMVNPALFVYRVPDGATLAGTAGAAPTITASGQDVILSSFTVNTASAYEPDGSTEFVDDVNFDIRSGEFVLSRNYTDISTNITADASFPGAAADARFVAVEVT